MSAAGCFFVLVRRELRSHTSTIQHASRVGDEGHRTTHTKTLRSDGFIHKQQVRQHMMHRPEHQSLVIASAFGEGCREWSSLLQEWFAVCIVSDPQALERVIANLKPGILILQLS